MNAMTSDMKATLKQRKTMMNDKEAFEMHLHFTVADAAEMAHVVGYSEFLELFQKAFLRNKQPPKPLSPEERQALFDNWEL